MHEQLVGEVVAHQGDDMQNTIPVVVLLWVKTVSPITVRGEGELMLTIIGVQRKSGVFQEKEYDNIMLHCTEDNPSTPTICGNVCETLKIKTKDIRDVFSGTVTCDSDWRDLLGTQIKPFFDRFGKVISVEMVSSDQGRG